MNDEIKAKLEEEIMDQLSVLSDMDVGSDKRKTAVDDLVKLYRLRIEETKNGWEYTDDSGNARWMFDGTCVVMPRPVECDGFDFGECESEFFYYDGDSTDASEYKMFLIYEEDDINNIIKILEWAKKGCPGDGPEQALRGEK